MAWQIVFSIKGQVRGFSQEERTQPSNLDSSCISLNSARGQGLLLGERRLAWLSKGPGSRLLTTGKQGQKAEFYLASLCLVGDLLFDLRQAACSS